MRKNTETNEKKVITSFTLSPTSLKLLDDNRGHEARSSFVDRLLQNFTGDKV
jgi:hypothetical protein